MAVAADVPIFAVFTVELRSEAELAAELVQLADAVDDEQPDPSLLSISPSSVPQSTEEHSNALPETG